jgi:hypothetical protein
MCLLGIEQAWQTSSTMLVPKILVHCIIDCFLDFHEFGIKLVIRSFNMFVHPNQINFKLRKIMCLFLLLV